MRAVAPYAVAYNIRVDLTDASTFIVKSTITYQVGHTQTWIDQVFANTAQAPGPLGTWTLKVDVYIWDNSGQMGSSMRWTMLNFVTF